MARVLPFKCVMTFLNLLIIYLACGSPFGVYQLTTVDGHRRRLDWVKAAVAFILWPLFLSVFVFKRLFPPPPSTKFRIERIREELESLVFNESETASIFEFRETFYRYVGLASFVTENEAQHRAGELIAISGRRLDEASSRSLARRNRDKVNFHLTQARNDFVDMIADLANDKRSGTETVTLGRKLANLVGDTTAMDDLDALHDQFSTSENSSDRHLTEGVWKAHADPVSKIS